MDDDLGLDTIETGATIAVAMEAGIIPFGDAAGRDPPAGRSRPRARRWAGWSPRAPTCSARPTAWSTSRRSRASRCRPTIPRAVQGIGVTYATSTMGADHTAGYAIAANLLGVGGKRRSAQARRTGRTEPQPADRHGGDRRAGPVPVRGLRRARRPGAPWRASARCSAACTAGRSRPTISWPSAANASCRRSGAFNAAAGFTAADDRLPDFFKTEKLAPHDITFVVPDEELDKVFDFVP